MDTYMEQALDQRSADFQTVRAWVFEQIEHNQPQFAHDLACMLAGNQEPDFRAADAAAVDELRGRMADAVLAQPATAELAEWLRERAEEEAREAEDEADEAARYADACERAIPNPHC